MSSSRQWALLAGICSVVAALTVAVAAGGPDARPPDCPADSWIELGDGFGVVITRIAGPDQDVGTADARTAHGSPFAVETGPESDLAAWGGIGGHLLQPGLRAGDRLAYGHIMVRRNGIWHRFQPEPGPPAPGPAR